MSLIGLFPLELVLVPTERVPLHIFEPRYKELINECLETDEEFGIVLAKPSGDVHRIGTRAAVTEVLQVLDDGRMDVVVEGGDRFRLLEVEHERSFATGIVEEMVDDDDSPDDADIDKVLELYARIQEALGAPGEPPGRDSETLDFELTARVGFSNVRKQELLELTSRRERFARLAVMLDHALSAVVLEQEMRQRAHSNGKVTPLEP